MYATSRGRTIVKGTRVGIVAVDLTVNAAIQRITGVNSASVGIIAVDCGVDASSERRNARRNRALVSGGADNVGEDASTVHGAIFSCAWVVICAIAATLTVTPANSAPIRVGAIQRDGGIKMEIGRDGVSFIVEQIERVVSSNLQRKICQHQIDAFCRVDTSKVNYELVVDEHPNIVVTNEIKDLGSLKGESGVKLEREVVIVVLVVISKSLSVDGIEVVVDVTVSGRVARDS
jgi:hypothetical protein